MTDTFCYAYKRTGPWHGSFSTRALAEEAAREGTFNFVMVWTAKKEPVWIGELISFNSFSEVILNAAYTATNGCSADVDNDPVHSWKLWDLDDAAKQNLEHHIRSELDRWATKYNVHPTFLRYTDIEPGWYTIDYVLAEKALQGGDARYKSDWPVINEIHYMTLVGRVQRFQRRQKRVDVNGIDLDARIEDIDLALTAWDAAFPIPGLQRYERRIREIKDVLRSPWPKLTTWPKDDAGNRVYIKLSVEETMTRDRYANLQRELRWLKKRVTLIYHARKASKRSASETPRSTEAK